MSLAPHQKATVDVSALRTKIVALHSKISTWQRCPALDTALSDLQAAAASLAHAHTNLATLPASYASHASKVVTKDIEVDAYVSVREAKRKNYEGLGDLTKLKVIAVGQPFCTVELETGVRIAVKRGDLTTVTA